MFALHRDGKIMYISETASVHLGLPQIDLTGSSIYEYVHPSDHDDLSQVLELSDNELPSAINTDVNNGLAELGRSFCMRMRCVLPKRNAGLISSGFKAIHCSGYLKVARKPPLPIETNKPDHEQWASYALVAVGHPLLPAASTEVKLTGNSFMFRSNLDLKLHYIEENVTRLLGFAQKDMIGQSLYQFVHAVDLPNLESSHRLLLEKGQVVTKYYRLMKKHGGFIWIQSHATQVNSARTMPKPQQIVSVCLVLADNDLDKSAISSENHQDVSYRALDDQPQLAIDKAASISPQQLVSQPMCSDSELGDRQQDRTPVVLVDQSIKQQRLRQQERHSIGGTGNSLKKFRKLKTFATTNNNGNQNTVVQIAYDNSLAAENTQEIQYSGVGLNHRQCAWHNQGSATTPVPIRRASDDSCSIVSSIASTSISSVASSSTQSSEAYFASTTNNAVGHDSYSSTHFADNTRNYLFEQNELHRPCLADHKSPLNYQTCPDNQPTSQYYNHQHHHSVSPIPAKDIDVLEPLWCDQTPTAHQQQRHQSPNTFYLQQSTNAPTSWLIHHQTNVQTLNYNCQSLDSRPEPTYCCASDQKSSDNEITYAIYQDQSPPYVSVFADPVGPYNHHHNTSNIYNASCSNGNMYSL